MAHLLAGVFLEGAINQVAAPNLEQDLWQKIERLNPTLKWFIAAQQICDIPFPFGEEPLNTVKRVAKTRNRIAHANAMDSGHGMILRYPDGRLVYSPSDDTVLEDGLTIYANHSDILAEFSAASAKDVVTAAIEAVRELGRRARFKEFIELDAGPFEPAG